VARPRHLRRKEIGFGGYEAWEEQVYAEEARAAERSTPN
jgi:ABC transport system ATP-binding/permease protein